MNSLLGFTSWKIISCKNFKLIFHRKREKLENKLKFKIEEIDISKHPDLLQKYQIMVSPGIVIDGKLEFTGKPSEKRLKEKLLK